LIWCGVCSVTLSEPIPQLLRPRTDPGSKKIGVWLKSWAEEQVAGMVCRHSTSLKYLRPLPGGQTINFPSRLRVLRVRPSDRLILKTHAKSRRTRSSVSGCCNLTFLPSGLDI
jgi:hypothetical protein